ncbi:hypothetical protein CRE_04205 [Caenorhabditis remanei]|uniref:F-box domain-containing protein n=1 Tax=Caenorhabditis remanei TaxID=31234 RepID=E3MYP2_CAERE|nr:hypothetical protein CRE_04205 [Caenorhabditis remanei]
MTSPFRLFSLPHVPLKQVLNNVEPEALLILSMCSRRSKSIAVSFRGPSKHVRLSLNFGLGDRLEGSDKRDVLLVVKKNLPMDHNTMETVRIGSFEKVPVRMEFLYQEEGEQCLITYWEDGITGLTAIGDYVREVFNRDISEMMIGEKQDEDDHRRAAEWVKNSQGTIQILHCDFKPKIDNDLDLILENFNCTERLSLYVKPSEHYSPARMPNFKVDSLNILFSFWIKQDHLLTMNCKYIVLQYSKLTNQDFNAFVKHWIAGGCSQLKKLWVTVEEPIDYGVVLDGVEFTERARDVERVFVDERRTSHIITGGFDVKRSNVTATVVDIGQQSQLFFMIVW